jgi:hypothetical protein
MNSEKLIHASVLALPYGAMGTASSTASGKRILYRGENLYELPLIHHSIIVTLATGNFTNPFALN